MRWVANRSMVGDPHLRMIFFATCGWRDHSAPSTWFRRLRRSARTFDCPRRYLASRSTLWASVQRRSCPVNSQRESDTVPPFVDVRHHCGVIAHGCHSLAGDRVLKSLQLSVDQLNFRCHWSERIRSLARGTNFSSDDMVSQQHLPPLCWGVRL